MVRKNLIVFVVLLSLFLLSACQESEAVQTEPVQTEGKECCTEPKKPLIPTEYEGFEIALFNKILCVGDSLTAGTFNHGLRGDQYEDIGKYSYPTYLQRLTGVETVNHGLGARTAANWYNEMKNQDLSGFDCAIIQLGVNDALKQEGGWNETSAQAYNNIIAKLKQENKRIKIFVSTIIPADSYLSESLIAASESIRNWYAGLEDQTDIFLLDMAVYAHTNDSAAYQAGHLSAYGNLVLAKDYQAYISYVIATEKEKFQWVQFSNSDYGYKGQ